MWVGAFLSFFGSQLQGVAQGQYVWQLTHREDLLAYVGTVSMLPGTILFPFVGLIVDVFDKRVLMTICMVVLGLGAAVLGFAVQNGTATYWLFFYVSLVSGVLGTLELPTRQSIIRDVVPPEDISRAVPLQAMTFNLARILGPATAGLILTHAKPVWCFYLNALSFAALIYSPWVMKADFTPTGRSKEPIKDLIFEGMLYTWRHPSLRKALILECATSLFSLIYINQLPAYVDKVLHAGRAELGYANSAIGVGAMTGLLVLGFVSEKKFKPMILRIAVSCVVVALLTLVVTRVVWLAYIALALAGAGTIMQFNTTNTLFQTTPPTRLKGRVLTMHFWALSGLAPIGLLVFGQISQGGGLLTALFIGGLALGLVALWGWTKGLELRDPAPHFETGAT